MAILLISYQFSVSKTEDASSMHGCVLELGGGGGGGKQASCLVTKQAVEFLR